jgi:hypothetical protein
MRVHLDFKGVPILYKPLNRRKEIDLDVSLQRCTLKQLIEILVRRFGVPVKKALLDQNGNIDMEIRVLLNQAGYLGVDRMETVLQDGDALAFLGAA